MRHCLHLAQETKGSGNTPVGAILVKNGKIIAEGKVGDKLLQPSLAHAEIIAILNAESLGHHEFHNAIMYTTVEPCFMCSYLIRQKAVGTIVYGTTTPAGGDSSDFPFLRSPHFPHWDNPPRIIPGVLKEECEALL